MTCCIVGTLILLAVRGVRRRPGVGPGNAAALFAPVAYRPGAGVAAVVPGRCATAAVEPSARGARRRAGLFGYCALGVAVSLAAVPLLIWVGVARNAGTPAVWLARNAFYVALAIAVLGLSRQVTRFSTPRGVGWLLMAVGMVTFELGVLDMHVFRVFRFADEYVPWDGLFHDAGPLLAAAGALLVVGQRVTSRRPSRSTSTSAQPSTSAMTVSSTPPVTA